MTREELTKVLKDWKPELELMAKYNNNSIDYQRYTALDMAIKALEQEPVLDKIRAEIKQLPYQRIFGNVSSYSLLDTVVEIIDKYRAESEG